MSSQLKDLKLTDIVYNNAADIDLSAKQDVLVSGTNIKTVNSNSLLGSGDIVITGTTPTVATGAEVDTGTDNTKMVTPKAMEDSSYSKLALGELSTTAYRGDRGKIAYDHSQAAHAPSDADKTVDTLLLVDQETPGDTNKFLHHNDTSVNYVTFSDLKQALKDYFDTLYVAQ